MDTPGSCYNLCGGRGHPLKIVKICERRGFKVIYYPAEFFHGEKAIVGALENKLDHGASGFVALHDPTGRVDAHVAPFRRCFPRGIESPGAAYPLNCYLAMVPEATGQIFEVRPPVPSVCAPNPSVAATDCLLQSCGGRIAMLSRCSTGFSVAGEFGCLASRIGTVGSIIVIPVQLHDNYNVASDRGASTAMACADSVVTTYFDILGLGVGSRIRDRGYNAQIAAKRCRRYIPQRLRPTCGWGGARLDLEPDYVDNRGFLWTCQSKPVCTLSDNKCTAVIQWILDVGPQAFVPGLYYQVEEAERKYRNCER